MISEAALRKLAAERAALSSPIDRIVLDNRWVDGLPLGLHLIALQARDAEVAEIEAIAEMFKVDVWEMVLIATGSEPTSESDPLTGLSYGQVTDVLCRMRTVREEVRAS